MIDPIKVQHDIEALRQRYINEPEKRWVIKIQGRLLKRALELYNKRFHTYTQPTLDNR